MDKREDIRVTRSKRDLCNALVELVKEKPFKKITVADICASAMINKMTFYKHYADKYELLNDVFLGIKRQITARAESVRGDIVGERGTERLFLLLDAVLEECLNYRDFISAVTGDDMALTMISTTMEKSIRELMESYATVLKFKYNLDVLIVAITGAVTFMIRYWLVHEPESSKEQFFSKSKEFLIDIFKSKILFD